jgi:hypothetical protein
MKKNPTRFLLTVLVFAIGFAHVFAQEPPPIGAISGVVINADSTIPMQGVIVRALQDGAEICRDTTDSDGHYIMPEMQLGVYDIEASHAGFTPQTETGIEVFPDQTTTINFGLYHTCVYVEGDANGNGAMNGIDVTYGVRYFKCEGPPPPYTCFCDGHTWYVSGDVNGDCIFNGLDIVYIIGHYKCGYPYHSCPACPGFK